jgi:photosystem II stability/assembly factor-like uncharacterized protein
MNYKQLKLIVSLCILILIACIPDKSTFLPAPTITPEPTLISPTLLPTTTASPTETSTPEPTLTAISTLDRKSDAEQLAWVSASADLYNRVVTFDLSNKERIAYCTSQEIRVSDDGGKSWNSIPIAGVSTVAEIQGYTIFNNDPSLSLACMSVTLDSQNPQSYYAVFTTAHEEYGAPPVFYMGFVTYDDGLTWQLVPPPSETSFEEFGGFWTDGDGRVEALFTKPRDLVEPAGPVYVQETSDGGITWTSSKLHCPVSGPCLRWGPAVSNIPGMGSPLPQSILLSLDQGQTWSFVEPPVELRAPPPNQLVAFSNKEVAIISGSILLGISEQEADPLRITQDGGLTWEAILLPPPLFQETDFVYYPGLQILPDRSLISQTSERNDWLLLPPSSQNWCPISSHNLPSYPVLLQAIGDQLWWVNSDTGQAEQITLTEISCAGS